MATTKTAPQATRNPIVGRDSAANPAEKEGTQALVRIAARLEGVFCCGQRHGQAPTNYPLGWFSEGQLAELSGHPDLTLTRT